MHSKSLHEGIVTTSSKWQNLDSDQVNYTSQITTQASADTKIHPVSLTPEWRCVDSAIGNWGFIGEKIIKDQQFYLVHANVSPPLDH